MDLHLRKFMKGVSVVMLVVFSLSAHAQQTVSGRVVSSDDNAGLPGVNIVIKGSSVGTTTDTDGRYSIPAKSDDILVFTFIGYADQEVVPGARTVIDIVLQPEIGQLDEIVVVGYGVVQKKDLIGAVGTASKKDFGDVAVTNASQLVQGKISGVQVINNNGLPGSDAKIVIRGTGSFTNTNPLYVIDGIQGGQNEFNAIAPYDIESITILKDAASTAIYGANAANGVVIVTTKKAKSGTPTITYNGFVGFAEPWKQLDLMNARQYNELVRDIQDSRAEALTPKLESDYVLTDRTDWQDAIYRKGMVTEHNIGISGGSEKSTYSVSTTYSNQDGILEDFNFKRLNFRFALEQKVGKRFKFGESYTMRYSIRNGVTPSFTDALRMPTYSPIFDETNLGGYARVTSNDDLNDAFNPLTRVGLTDSKNRDYLNYIQLFGEVEILKGLTFRSQFSISIRNYNSYAYTSANKNGNLTNPNSIVENYETSISPLLENYFSYNKSFGIHQVNFTLGNTYIHGGSGRNVELSGSGFPNDQLKNIWVAPTSRISGGSGFIQTAGISYFARANYTLLDKYIVTASFRRDGSPNFPAGNKFGNFPGIGLGWKISDEAFMSGVSWLSQLKLRGSWGITGNSNIPQQYASVWKGQSNNIVYSLGGNENYVQGSTINSTYDPTLRWEQTVQTDVGLDIGLLEDRLNFSVGYYNRDNNDLLLNVPVRLSSGLGGPYDNVGSVLRNGASAVNKGFEISAELVGQTGDFRYNIGGNFSQNTNTVTSMGGIDDLSITSGGINGSNNATRTEIGQPIGSFYGYRVDHVAVSQAEVDSYNAKAIELTGDPAALYQPSLKPGDILFRDLNGDGVITDQDREFLGSPIPKIQYGGNITLGWKNFDFMASIFGVAGVKIWNDNNYWLEGTSRPFNSSADLNSRWKQEGDISDFPRAGQNATSNLNLRPSDRWVKDGAFMRLRNVTLGYALPKSILGSNLSNVRFYITAQNLVTITKYDGYDPELGNGNNSSDDSRFIFSRGIDSGNYPQPRTYMVGVQVGF